jgi:site-specific DNA recombinase
MFGNRDGIAPDQVAAYIRWSTDEQGHGTTLAVQRERVEWFIRSQGWACRDELIFVDEGYSGGSLERPALSRLREAVRAGQVRCVVVYRLDRLSRSLLDTVNLVRREWEGRAVLCSATENFDTHSPVGQMVFNILASFAEFERSLIRERTASGKRKRAEQGRNAGQRYPLGYRKGAGGWALNGRDESGCLTGPAALVRRIFDGFLSGMSTGTIARLLNAEGILTPMGRPWRFHYVARILRNPIYAGRYRYGRGAAATLVPGAVEALVSDAEFDQVQAWLRQRSSVRSPPASYLLTGLARCGRCGSPIAGSRGRGKRYYVCTGRTLLHRCDCGYMDADAVEGALLAEVCRLLPCGPPQTVLERWRQEAAGEQHGLLRQIEAEGATLDRQRRRAEDEYLAGKLTARSYSRLVERLEAGQAEVEGRLERTRDLLAALSGTAIELGPDDPWTGLTEAERREVLRLMTERLTLYRPPGTGPAPSAVEVAWCPRRRHAPPPEREAGS